MHEGRLIKRSDGRYALDDGWYWTCGDYMELYYDNEWLVGRVEYSTGYYFTDGDCIEIPLEFGMLVRGK